MPPILLRRILILFLLATTFPALRAQDSSFGVDTSRLIENAPFSARLMMAMNSTGNGTSIAMAINGNVYRDSAGRIRVDMEMPMGGPSQMQMTELFDYTQHSILVWTNQTKIAMHHDLPAPVESRKLAPRAGSAAGQAAVPDPPGTPEMLNGIKVFKSHQNVTIPAQTAGTAKPTQMQMDVWYAPAFAMPLKMVALNSPMGDFTFELTDLKQEEPAADLFRIPDGYATQELALPK